jgi:hypothetical protein
MIYRPIFFRSGAMICLYIILFQGCKVYYKQTVTLEQAFDSDKKVKIITVDGKKMYFERLKIEYGVLYGIQKSKGQYFQVILPPQDIQEIHLMNIKATRGYSLVIFFGSIGGFSLLLYGIFLFFYPGDPI